VSKETFKRFTQFVYTGDYLIPKIEKQNRVIIQKEAVTDDSSSDSFYILIKRLDEAKAETVDEPEPAGDLNIDLKGSGEPEPEAAHDFFTSKKDKKDKKKKAKSADLRPSWIVESLVPTTDIDREQGTIPITKRDKYPERYSRVYLDDF
jgi:hypothetical protein